MTTDTYTPIRHRSDLELAREWYEGLDQFGRYATALTVGPANSAPVRQAAREELQRLIEEWHGEAPAKLVRTARAHIERLR